MRQMKIYNNIAELPEISVLSKKFNVDDDAIVGKLLRLLCWFDQHNINGVISCDKKNVVDVLCGITGFYSAAKYTKLIIDDEHVFYLSYSPQYRRSTTKKLTVSDFDWSAWPETPSNDILDMLVEIKKSHKQQLTQRQVDSCGKQILVLEKMGIGVDIAIKIWRERRWHGMKADWIIQHVKNYMPDFYEEIIPKVNTPRKTRDISIVESLTNRSWAEPVRSSRDISIVESLTDRSWAES